MECMNLQKKEALRFAMEYDRSARYQKRLQDEGIVQNNDVRIHEHENQMEFWFNKFERC